jgi:opine dehydrogenase
MLNQPIAVLGGGSQGHAIAADLTLSGYKVNLYAHPQFANTLKATLEKGVVEIEDLANGRREQARIHRVTTDIEEAICDAKLILEAIPSYGEDLFFNTMIPQLKDGQVVALWAENFGALRLRKLLNEKASETDITIYGISTVPYGARMVGPASVCIPIVKSHGHTWLGEKAPKETPVYPLVYSALPSKHTDAAFEEFIKLYPFYSPTKNVLVSAMHNANFIGHPIAAVLNAGRIEYAHLFANAEFRFHQEAHTPSVQLVEEAVADEIAALVKSLGGETTVQRTLCKDLFERAQALKTILGPITLKDRYIIEDVPYGLVPMSQLGEKLGVATPLMNAFVEIASALIQEDYRQTGRNLESLGLAGLSKEQILNLL